MLLCSSPYCDVTAWGRVSSQWKRCVPTAPCLPAWRISASLRIFFFLENAFENIPFLVSQLVGLPDGKIPDFYLQKASALVHSTGVGEGPHQHQGLSFRKESGRR